MADARDLDRSLRLARQVFAPSPDNRARVRHGLAAHAALRGEGPRLVAGPRRLGLLDAALFVGVGFSLGYWFAGERHAEPAPRADAAPIAPMTTPMIPTPMLPTPTSPTLATPPSPGASGAERSDVTREPEHPRPAPVPKRHRPSAALPRAARDDTFADELSLLRRAERAIRAGDGSLARSFIDDLDARLPVTSWQQERAAIRVLAACVLREPACERDALAFLQRQPGSVYFDRIRAVCHLEADPLRGEILRGRP